MIQQELARRQIERDGAPPSLALFLKAAWGILEPATPLAWNWHIDALCEHLEAVVSRQIRNLIICVPPGSTKSMTSAVMLPAWAWIEHPELRFLYASHDQRLSTRDSVKSRRLIESEWYQKRWGHRYQMTGDQNVKSHFENDKTGFRMAGSVRSATTGHRANILIIDDPHDARKVEGEADRLETILWHDQAWFNRVTDETKCGRIVIGQRVHHKDLIGHLLERGDYELLCIPEEYEPDRCKLSTGWTDPRTQLGELLRPDRFGPEQVRQTKLNLGSLGYATQHQQRPSPREGLMFHRDWFRVVEATVKEGRVVRAWDLAASSEGDWSVGVRMRRKPDNRFVIENVVRGRWTPHERDAVILQTAEMDGREVMIVIEEEGGASGKSLSHQMRMLLAGHMLQFVRPTGDKVIRANALAAQAEGGMVDMLRGEFNLSFLDELCSFPLGEFDDQVDAASHAMNELVRRGQIAYPDKPIIPVAKPVYQRESAAERRGLYGRRS